MAAVAAELEGTSVGAPIVVWDSEEGLDLASPADLLVVAAAELKGAGATIMV